MQRSEVAIKWVAERGQSDLPLQPNDGRRGKRNADSSGEKQCCGRHTDDRGATLRNWQQGRTRPDGPARVLLAVIARHPEAVEDALRQESGTRTAAAGPVRPRRAP